MVNDQAKDNNMDTTKTDRPITRAERRSRIIWDIECIDCPAARELGIYDAGEIQALCAELAVIEADMAQAAARSTPAEIQRSRELMTAREQQRQDAIRAQAQVGLEEDVMDTTETLRLTKIAAGHTAAYEAAIAAGDLPIMVSGTATVSGWGSDKYARGVHWLSAAEKAALAERSAIVVIPDCPPAGGNHGTTWCAVKRVRYLGVTRWVTRVPDAVTLSRLQS